MDSTQARQVRLMGLMQRLPQDRPFTTAEATACGLSFRALRALVSEGLLTHPLRGVYHSSSIAESLTLRVQVLRLVVPRHCVVTDRTAAWLWGAERVLPPGAHLAAPQVSLFCPPGSRLRNKLVDSGQRMLRLSDIESVEGLQVTTPLRTACDVGRLLHRDQAIGVLDALSALDDFRVEELIEEAKRFKGFRGVVQLRYLAPLIDKESGSPGESTLRLRWLEAPLPRPKCQAPVRAPNGGHYYVDIGLPERRFGAEYFGEEFHDEEVREHDEGRLEWMRTSEDWLIVVARKHNVYGQDQDITGMLIAGARECGLIR